MTDSGWFVCLQGHGACRMDTYDIEAEDVLPGLFITGEEE